MSNKNARNVKKAAKAAKKHPKIAITLIIILVVIIAAAAVLYFVRPDIVHNFFDNLNGQNQAGGNGGDSNGGTGGGTGGEAPAKPLEGTEAEIAESGFSIHFLELGNKSAGDCVLIDCGDVEVLIDAGSEQNSADDIKAYVDKYCNDNTLEYVISTHADSDHISAFYGESKGGTRTGIFYQYNVGTLIKFDRTHKTTNIYNNYLGAIEQLKEKGTQVFTASQCYDERDGAMRQYYLDEAQTLSINILYNYYYYNNSSDENNFSVVTLLTKETPEGNKHFLFTGDLEEDGEKRLVQYYSTPSNSKSEFDILPEVELYKAGHHGSKTSSNEVLIDVIKPKNVAVCCCAGSPEYTKNNLNTFPTQAMIDHVGKYTKNIFVTTLATDLPVLNANGEFASKTWGFTSMNGNIVFYWGADESGNAEIKLYCSNDYTLLKDTEWFKTYRTWNGVA